MYRWYVMRQSLLKFTIGGGIRELTAGTHPSTLTVESTPQLVDATAAAALCGKHLRTWEPGRPRANGVDFLAEKASGSPLPGPGRGGIEADFREDRENFNAIGPRARSPDPKTDPTWPFADVEIQ